MKKKVMMLKLLKQPSVCLASNFYAYRLKLNETAFISLKNVHGDTEVGGHRSLVADGQPAGGRLSRTGDA